MTEERPRPWDEWKTRIRLFSILLIILGTALVLLGSLEDSLITGGSESGGCLFWPIPVIFVCGFGSGVSVVPLALLVFTAVIGTVVLQVFLLGWRRKKSG